MAPNPRYVWNSGRSVVAARWYLRHADEVGTASPVQGRPAVKNAGRMVIGDRVQLVSTIATLELVPSGRAARDRCPARCVNFGVLDGGDEARADRRAVPHRAHTMMLDNDFHRIEPERRLERPESKPIAIEDNVWIGARVFLSSAG